MTSSTRRNRLRRFGRSKPAITGLLGAPLGQPEDVRDVVELGRDDAYDHTSYEAYGYAPNQDASRFGDGSFRGYEDSSDHPTQPFQPFRLDDAPEAGAEGHGRQLSRDAGRRTGRHASAPGKATRKRVGRVVPVAAVAAALAAGTATVYGLTNGHSQAANASAADAIHGAVASAATSAPGQLNAAAASPIRVATATASTGTASTGTASTGTASPAASTPAKPAAKATRPPAAAPSASATHTAAVIPAAAPAVQAATHTATVAQRAATTVSCNLGAGLLPQNVTAIVSFLVAHGYSGNAAAGIAGNMYQESKGDPESVGSGGGGLIGFTPLPSGYVTGSPASDLQKQLSAVLTYNQIWAQFLPALNAAASPSAAADIYVTDFERAGIPAASTREASATDVASACGI